MSTLSLWGLRAGALSSPSYSRLSGTVHVLGVLSNDDRDAIVAGSAVMCYPSLFEGFGLPVLEAMAQGTPVVTSAGIATEEAAGGAALLVDPYDVEAIVTALAEVLEDDARADQLREAGRHRAAAMSWQTHAELTKAAYREVLGA